MGTVYHADDLSLVGVTVALKFPARDVARDSRRRAQLAEEVRLARLVTDAHVCRTIDLHEHDGFLYFSMQWVDGKDLAFLLKTCARFPETRGLEIALEICEGLDAIHAHELIHRDLKPSNILIDSNGNVLLTDFGIASVAGSVAHPRSGTLAYMSPEQLAGREITHLSDIYSLGIVLYELFTGKSLFANKSLEAIGTAQAPGGIPRPSSIVPGIDATIERVILKCLEPEPAQRPQSAKIVAAALRGERTPTPRQLADVGTIDPLPLWRVAAMAAATFICLSAVCLITTQIQVVNHVPLENSAEVLTARARQIVRSLGWESRHGAAASGFRYQSEILRHFRERLGRADMARQWRALVSTPPTPLSFWIEESAQPFVARDFFELPERQMDAFLSGTIAIDVDPDGRLSRLSVAPSRADGFPPPGTVADWSLPFGLAGLDITRFSPQTPVPVSGITADVWTSWSGRYPGDRNLPIRINAGSYRGKITYFDIMFPWTRPQPGGPSDHDEPLALMLTTEFILLSVVAALGWYRCRTDTADLRGAWRLGLFMLVASMASVILGASFSTVEFALVVGIFQAVVASTCYLAFEPWVRRTWPEAACAWSKVLAGRWNEAVVGRDVLVAGLFASMNLLIRRAVHLAAVQFGLDPLEPGSNVMGFSLANLNGWHGIASAQFDSLLTSLQVLLFFLVLCVVRSRVRHAWTAMAFALPLLLLLVGPPNVTRAQWITGIDVLLDVSLMLVVMTAYGLFAGVAFGAISLIVDRSVLTVDFFTWYGNSSAAALAFVAVVIGVAAWVAAGQPRWRVAAVSREP